MDREKQERNCSPAGLTPARRSWRLSTARIPVVYGGKGVVDGMLSVTARSGMRSVR
jgi:hypothetical protein